MSPSPIDPKWSDSAGLGILPSLSPALMAFDWEEFRPWLLCPDLPEDRHVANIVEMSRKFTIDRQQIDDYLSSPERVSSYAAFYLPTNIPKLLFLWEKLPLAYQWQLLTSPFIDCGCGPGTFSLALARLAEGVFSESLASSRHLPFGHPPSPLFYGWDQSPAMLAQAEKLFHGLYPHHQATFSQHSPSVKTSHFLPRTLCFGHAVNEMGLEKALKIVADIAPSLLLIIEPATSTFFSTLLALRRELAGDFDILYPCPVPLAEVPCPQAWCHQVLRLTHHPNVERLAQKAALDRKILPTVCWAFARRRLSQVPHVGPREFLGARESSWPRNPWEKVVTVRFWRETKHSFEYDVCHATSIAAGDAVNEVCHVSLPKRNLNKAQQKRLKKLSIGEFLSLGEMEKIDENYWRGQLLDLS